MSTGLDCDFMFTPTMWPESWKNNHIRPVQHSSANDAADDNGKCVRSVDGPLTSQLAGVAA